MPSLPQPQPPLPLTTAAARASSDSDASNHCPTCSSGSDCICSMPGNVSGSPYVVRLLAKRAEGQLHVRLVDFSFGALASRYSDVVRALREAHCQRVSQRIQVDYPAVYDAAGRYGLIRDVCQSLVYMGAGLYAQGSARLKAAESLANAFSDAEWSFWEECSDCLKQLSHACTTYVDYPFVTPRVAEDILTDLGFGAELKLTATEAAIWGVRQGIEGFEC